MAESQGSQLFNDQIFAFVVNRDLPLDQANDLRTTLEDHAGTVLDIAQDGRLDLGKATHIISATTDFPQYADARFRMTPVVTPSWITQSLLKNKMAQVRPFTPDENLFFSDVNISCADIPTGDKDAIIGAVLAMGGMESSSLTKLTTHICALTLDHPKCQQALLKNIKCKIVLPHWFDDCLKLGKRIDERPYLLPDPEIFRINPEENVPIPGGDRIRGASSSRPNLSLPTDTIIRHLSVFEGRKVMISADLGISSRHLKVLEDLIEDGGGSITSSVHKANMYVCQWREGEDYLLASWSGIDVGNLSWLYFLITHNEWTSPLRRLLHYPLPKEGIPGFHDFRITLSNYGGEARTYLENLVVACGGEFTKSMKQDNTHLVTARKSSEKCTAAEEWNICMINHLWLEESYAKCEVQSLTTPRYTHFPPRTNLGEVIGETQFDAGLLAKKYYPRDPTPSLDDPKLVRRPVMQEKDKNLTSSSNTVGDFVMCGQEDNVETMKAPAMRKRSKSTINVEIRTPAPNRRISAGKENDTPSSTGSRSAKNKAISRISDLAPDINLYEKEKKRKGPIWGGERAANKIEKERSLERGSSPDINQEEEVEEEAEQCSSEEPEEMSRTPKRQRTGLPPIAIRLLITGYTGWIDSPTKEDLDKKKLREVGVLVVQDPCTCTHLAAPNMVRTKKFLCGLANGPVVVSSDFIDTCIKMGEIPNVDKFLLKDPDNEAKLQLKLKNVVARAKANKRSLLRGVPIYCTMNVQNGPETYKAIVEANGGTFSIYRGRPTIKKMNPEEDDGPAEPVYLITGNSPDERKLWAKFTEMAETGNMIPRIVMPEWLLDVAMSQQHNWDDKYLIKNE